MPDACLTECPVLGEMTYQKMMSVQMLNVLNNHFESVGVFAVATGALDRETKNVMIARKAYREADSTRKMHDFVSAFNKLNGYSMIAHPVGMHHDHFRADESLENKIMFTLPLGKKRLLGRGGSILGKRFVFALLDW